MKVNITRREALNTPPPPPLLTSCPSLSTPPPSSHDDPYRNPVHHYTDGCIGAGHSPLVTGENLRPLPHPPTSYLCSSPTHITATINDLNAQTNSEDSVTSSGSSKKQNRAGAGGVLQRWLCCFARVATPRGDANYTNSSADGGNASSKHASNKTGTTAASSSRSTASTTIAKGQIPMYVRYRYHHSSTLTPPPPPPRHPTTRFG